MSSDSTPTLRRNAATTTGWRRCASRPPASPNVRGPVFNHAWFAFAGFTRSRRPEAHHNRLNAYRLTPEGRAAMEVEQ